MTFSIPWYSDDDSNEDIEMDVEAPTLQATTFVDSIKSLEDVQLFLDKKVHVTEANNLRSSIGNVHY